MTLAHPAMLWGAASGAVLAALSALAARRARRRVRAIDPRWSRAGRWRRVLAPGLALAMLFLALAGPHWGFAPVKATLPESDVVIVLDTSGSMLVRDAPPTRFRREKDFARALLAQLPPSVRVALVRVEGAGEIVSPLTLDRGGLTSLLASLSVRGAATPGSNLGAGIARARALLSARRPQGRAIVLLSDGEDLDGGLAEEVGRCRAAGIPLFTVVAGTRRGGPVPARKGGILSDWKGDPVVSHADPAAMESASRRTGGLCVRLAGVSTPAAPVTSRIAELGGRPGGSSYRIPADRSAWPAALALLLLGAALAPETRERG